MNDREIAAFRPVGSWPDRRRLYRAIYDAFELAPDPCDALFEATSDAPVPTVYVRPAGLARAWSRGSDASAPPPLPRPLPPSRDPALPPTHVYGLIPESRRDGGGLPSVRTGPVGRPVGVQTFWAGGRPGPLRAARRIAGTVRPGEGEEPLGLSAGLDAARVWASLIGLPARPRLGPRRAIRDWVAGGTATLPPEAWAPISASAADRSAEAALAADPRTRPPGRAPTLVLGASGAGKTVYLADRAAAAARGGASVVALDLHGDLAPAIVARLPPRERAGIVAIDVEAPPTPGIAGLAGEGERAAAHLVAALKRHSAGGAEVYWGFRLERILDVFVRLAQERGGSLLDVYGLLTDRGRQEEARLATRRPELARFLEELGPITRRTPEFLWPATARLAKLLATPRLGDLLAPADGGVPVEALLRRGRTVLVRIPAASLGPEAASFAATVLLARIYFGLAAERPVGGPPWDVYLVLDEAHGYSPPLLGEIVAEGRKFGLRTLLATQLAERLAPDLRSTIAGVAGEVVAFRVPRASAVAAGAWLGLAPAEAERTLPALGVGEGLARDPESAELVPIVPAPAPAEREPELWSSRVDATRREFGARGRGPEAEAGEPATERLLLALLAAEEEGRALTGPGLVDAAAASPGPAIDRALLVDRARSLERQGFLATEGARLRLTLVGSSALGLSPVTGASRESAEHRTLILRAFRTFARRGCRIEIVRQGRFDTTLPDARFRQLSEELRARPPPEIAAAITAARDGWAWRYFHGRDVHVEAEVSGAERRERIRRGIQKAERHGAFVLFVVADARRARRVRSVLRDLGVGRERGTVWTFSSRPAPPAPDAPRLPPGAV